MSDHNERDTFSSSWGTVLSTAGVAIGLGNIWRFPYMMGKHGGAWFLLVYLVIAVAFGLPALMAEWSLARHTRRGPLGAFERAGMPLGRWASYAMILTVLMASSYYGVVVGWVLYFAVTFGRGAIGFAPPGDFGALSGSLPLQACFLSITVALCGLILFFGVRRGIESLSRWCLPLFFVLVIILLARVLTLDGASAGLHAFFVPRWENFSSTTPIAALGQVFFSFGLGGTFMLVYGSYLRDEEDIPRLAVLTAGADVGAALLAGMIVVPAAIIFGLPADSGPPFMFEVMPSVFGQMPGGAWFGMMFFVSVFLVALLSEIAAFEVVISALVDGWKWSRSRSVLLVTITSALLAIPAMLSLNYIEKSDLIWGSTMQPVGAILVVLAFAWCLNRGAALGQMRRHARWPVPTWLYYWIKFGIPTGIVSTLVFSWVS